jgi:type VI secretion system protein ImpH
MSTRDSNARIKPSSLPSQGIEEVLDRLQCAPHAFDFFQVARRLEAHFGRQNYPRIGFSKSRSGDPFHFGQRPFMDFAPRTIDAWSVEPLRECDFPRPSFLVYFFGLFGPNGALPLHLTEYALERQREGDYTFTNFANALQHRFLGFYYRAWAGSRIAADLDQPARERFSIYVGSFLGLGSAAAQGRDHEFDLRTANIGAARQADAAPVLDPALAGLARDWPKLFFTGRLAAQTRNAEGLESILQDYFGVPAEIQSFFGRWYELPEEDQCRLGSSSGSCALGRDVVVGTRIWDCQISFRIRLGPMNLQTFEGLLPGGCGFARLKSWVTQYVGYELDWDVQMVLGKDAVPDTVLGQAGRLGWTTFLKANSTATDRDECVLSPNSIDQTRRSAVPPSLSSPIPEDTGL